jgi:two-component system sensor histidine kinase PilS (NtrC family)
VSAVAGVATLSWPPAEAQAAGSFWISLRYFNFYRIAVASVFLLAVIIYGNELNLGSHDLAAFTYTSMAYLALAAAYHVVLRKSPAHFQFQLTLHVITDIAAITLLMYASGGMRSGLGVMLLISLAAAALVSRGKLMLFYAALASIAVLLEQSYWVLVHDSPTATFLQPGLMSIGYFATALITNQLAQRLIMNERVARQRGTDLANQLRVNQLVIQDVQDGVLVVDANGLVRQHNRRVSVLLGREPPELGQIEEYSEELARRLSAWRVAGGPATVSLRFPVSGRLVRARFVAAGTAGGGVDLVFLEDLSKLQEQAQQLKLAALGRLTANIAHEIRNPLSAMRHAGDLLIEELRAPQRDRLVQIIRDNTERLDRMVRDVLQLTRRDRVQAESIQLRPYLLAFVDEFAQKDDVPRECLVVEADAQAAIEFDRVHLNQVLWNLLGNACRHSRRRAGSVRLQASQRGNRVELHVIDDGDGVSKELQTQLFEPFFTTFASGTGLGLYIARELCAANGASLDYLDREQGADFRILWQAA